MTQKKAPAPHLSDHEFNEIQALIESRSGILFDSSRERFFSMHLREHMRDCRLANGSELLRAMNASNVEYDAVIERLLTQETSFFRYPAVYDALEKRVLPEMHVKKFWENPRSMRIWSAGCATGEEPYSIAIALADTLMFADAWNIEVLATDISQEALKFAERGLYPRRSLEGMSSKRIEAHFLIQRFFDYLEPGGYLFLGHSESIARVPVKFQAIVLGDCILYRKPSADSVQRLEPAMVEERS